ncbi:MAG: response regulator [Clostridia bacterium]|nr:response regulator [Clostridia bacterium]
MEALRVFVADVDRAYTDSVRAALDKRRDMLFYGSAADGNEALQKLSVAPADVLLLDLQLPGMSGGALMRALRETDHFPTCIVCTRFYSRLSVEYACRYGAVYFLYKPLDYTQLPKLVLECHRASRPGIRSIQQNRQLEGHAVMRRLSGLGFAARLCGTMYLADALMRLQAQPALLRNLSKGLYNDIAASVGASASCVERGLRNAIAVAYQRGALGQRFPRRPTNRQVLEYLLDKLYDDEW